MSTHTEWGGTTGKFGFGVTNDRGLRLLEFAKHYNLVLANTLHDHKTSRKVTWHAPNGVDKNQIDYLLVSKRFAFGIYSNMTRSFPGADIGSNHDIVMMTMKIKLRRQHRHTRVKYNLEKLRDPQIL